MRRLECAQQWAALVARSGDLRSKSVISDNTCHPDNSWTRFRRVFQALPPHQTTFKPLMGLCFPRSHESMAYLALCSPDELLANLGKKSGSRNRLPPVRSDGGRDWDLLSRSRYVDYLSARFLLVFPPGFHILRLITES